MPRARLQLPLQCQLDVEGDGGAGVDVKYVQHVGAARRGYKGQSCYGQMGPPSRLSPVRRPPPWAPSAVR